MEDSSEYKVEEFDEEILREYDIRGIVKKNLTENTAYTIGRAFGHIVYNNYKKRKVIVGYDGRLTSFSLQKALCTGLSESGLNVIKIGLCPTPMLYFSINNLNAGAGIMVTGSHNPPEYNGFKMVLENKPFYSNQIQELQSVVKSKVLKISKGNIKTANIIDNYVKRILQNIILDRHLKIGWDPGNGSVGITINKVINKLKNTTNYIINEKVDGLFPNHHPDPTVPKNLIQLQNLVKKNNCDIGFAFDGDGDRLGIVDNNCNIIWADQYMIILAEEISKIYKNASIIMDVKSSKVFFDEVKKMGCNSIMYKTGHSIIKDKMQEINSPLSGEMSGHIMYKDDFLGYDDALYVSLRFLRILSKQKQQLSRIINKYPKTFSTPETRFDVDESRKFKIVEEIKNRLIQTNLKLTTIDGVRVDADDGWWGIRASNTQNALTVRAEAYNLNALAIMKKNIENQLKQSGVKFKFSS